MDEVYDFRALVEDIEPGLSKEFNLVSGTDYNVSLGKGIKGNVLSFQALNDKAKPHAQDILAYLREQLDQRDNHNIDDLRYMGPVVFHAN